MLGRTSQRTPIKRKAPIKARRKRVPARIQRYWDSLPDWCQVPDCYAESVPHHILAEVPGKVGRRDDMLVVKLCPAHHNMGTISVHLLGSEAAFERETGVDLIAIALANKEAWEAKNG